jgi:hypothetical protein
MRKTPRHEVISLRLTETRLELLERYRQTLAGELQRDVSLSEAAFLALEDRATGMERVAARAELLKTPSTSLFAIRQQWESQHALSAAQWDVLAEYIRIAVEQDRHDPPMRPAIPSRESYLALLDAFQAVYEHRLEPASPHVWTYFGNLGGFLATSEPLGDHHPERQHQLLLIQIGRQRELLQPADSWQRPGNVGHCFRVAVWEEGVDSTTLDHLLAAYWPVLWRLAARGHWIRHNHKPVRGAVASEEGLRRQVALPPPMTAEDITLSFQPSLGADFVMSVEWRSRQFVLDINQYPELVEFHAMLGPGAGRPWLGRHYAMAVVEGSGVRRVSLMHRGMRVDLSATEWITLGGLVRDAWRTSQLTHSLSELQQEYGEHG